MYIKKALNTLYDYICTICNQLFVRRRRGRGVYKGMKRKKRWFDVVSMVAQTNDEVIISTLASQHHFLGKPETPAWNE